MTASSHGDELPQLSEAEGLELSRIVATFKERGSAVSPPGRGWRSLAERVDVVRVYVELDLGRPCDSAPAAEFAIFRLSDWPRNELERMAHKLNAAERYIPRHRPSNH
jgi:hypothetical protein